MTDNTCPLSARQLEILLWKSHSKTTEEIRQITGLTVLTINYNLTEAYKNTNTLNIAGLMAMAFRKGWIE